MTVATKSVGTAAFGVLLIVAGAYGWIGEASLLLMPVGLLVAAFGAGWLLSTQSRATFRRPHPAVCGLLLLAILLHSYGSYRATSDTFSYGFFLWALVPYVLVCVLGCFQGTRVPAIAGATLALTLDAWNYYEVAQSTSSTASLNFLWVPLWNTILVVPIATYASWQFLRKNELSNAP